MALHILDISCVKPLQPTQRFFLPLSYTDSLFTGASPPGNVLFFSHPPGNLIDLQALKHGLSVALVPFYPLAGRLHSTEDANDPLTIDCNDAGVEFVEAVIDLAFADLEEQHFPIRDDLVMSLSRNELASSDRPLLSIQFTRFSGGCGTGFAIGVAMDHVVVDGYSVFYFLNSWGECCRGAGVSLPPLHVRRVMEPECWGMEKFSKPRISYMDLGIPVHLLQKVFLRPSSAGFCKTMHFNSTAAQELKRIAIVESGNSRISTFQAVIACVWKRLCAAQCFPAHQQVRIVLPANFRQLIMPTMTDAFFGNASLTISASTTAGDLQRESLGLIAARINASTKVLKDQGFLREKLGSVEKDAATRIRLECELEEPVIQFMVGLGSKLPVFNVDVGMGSTMEAIRPAAFQDSSVVTVLRGKEEGSSSVSVLLPTQQSLEAFLSIPCPCIDI